MGLINNDAKHPFMTESFLLELMNSTIAIKKLIPLKYDKKIIEWFYCIIQNATDGSYSKFIKCIESQLQVEKQIINEPCFARYNRI